ncbi:receptor lectin kinase [Rhynchospora pubera]|uniref:non-specific serine/threonine protein kinase n=1 Tax=Rhynchospora pubera TaxID=906938 RepID=A0AAV8CMW1_9POAL|nr:receptor lectin kinase [Rhynchospora pubera]
MLSWLLFSCCCFTSLSIALPSAAPLIFQYNFSDASFDQANLRFEGDAFFNGHVINLSRDTANGSLDYSQGRMTYNQRVLLWDSSTGEITNFTTSFTFAIFQGTIDHHNGDGLAFFLSPYPSQLHRRSAGGCLGLIPNCNTLNTTIESGTVAVEFDSFKNHWDPSNNHFGIDVNTINSTIYKNFTSRINTGIKITCTISYDGRAKLLRVLVYSKDNPEFGNYSLAKGIDLRSFLPSEVTVGFSAATGSAVELHQILNWYFHSTLQPPNTSSSKSLKLKLELGIGLSFGAFIVFVMALVFLIWWNMAAKRGIGMSNVPYKEMEIDDELEKGIGPKRFQYEELLVATKNFKEEKLGQGAFGSVYKGFLSCLNIHVAIKRLSRYSNQGIKEYKSEVKIVSRLRHRNLVQLVGWCHYYQDLLLVYEYMPNGSLDTHLYSAKSILKWPVRYQIALGLGSALLYLHREWDQCVVHRDIKPSNIMLDSSFNAKLGDFGLARLINHGGMQTTLPAGTIGYLAPECFITGKTSTESDVYSFGIVLLEIASGRRPIMPEAEPGRIRLVHWVWELYGNNVILEAADEKLGGDFETQQMECLIVVGLWCTHPNPDVRPCIRKALNVLQFESPLPALPSKMPVPIFAPPMDLVSPNGASQGIEL